MATATSIQSTAPHPQATCRIDSTYTGPLRAWRALLGEAQVEVRKARLDQVQVATFATQQRVSAVLRPANRDEVQGCLRIAQRYRVPIYPISTGKNWGYGSAVPSASDCALLDLSRLNRILDYDERLGCVTVEPGVTQRQLFAFLRERGGQFWMDATGASPDCSIVGNTLERGFGHTPYGDHFAHLGNLEVILPNGDCVQTGLGRFEGAKAVHAYRAGIGPALEGLFAQSNLGIVTRITLWLMPAPEYFQAFFFSVEEDGQLESLVEALAPLRLDGTLRGALHIVNDLKVLSSIQQYPWEEMNGRTPLSPEVLERLRRRLHIGAWNGSGGLYGTRAQVAAARSRLRAALKGKVQRLHFLDDRMLRIANFLSRPYQWLTGAKMGEFLKMLQPLYGLLKGEPTESQVASVYWRKKTRAPESADPNRDHCGLVWLAPIAPAKGECAREMVELVRAVLTEYAFEPAISITMLTERTLDLVIGITYDRDIPGEDARAMECHDRLLSALIGAGYYPYRLGIQHVGKLPVGEAAYTELLCKLKEALDPNEILAPGRYLPRREASVMG